MLRTLLLALICAGAALGQIQIEAPPAGNLPALTVTGSVQPGGSISAQVVATPGSTVYLGISNQTAYEVLSIGTVLIDLTTAAITLGQVGSSRAFNFGLSGLPALPAGLEFDLQAAISPPTGPLRLTNRVRVFFLGQPQSLQLVGVQNHSVTIGDALQFTVSSMGGQQPVVLSASPMPLPANMTFDAATGILTFRPDVSQATTFPILFSATDSSGSVSMLANIMAVMPPPGTPTALSGRVLNSYDSSPVSNVTVSLGGSSPSTVTASDGTFHLSGLPPGEVTIVFNGTTATFPNGSPTSQVHYPYLPEPVTLLPGVNNIITRPVYLPTVNLAAAQSIQPNVTNCFTEPVHGITVCIAPNSATLPNGQPYTGPIAVVRVPPEHAPMALPQEFQPAHLISIQPGGIHFNPPAQLRLPNDESFPPGAPIQLWSVDPADGQFHIIGMGQVDANGQSISTISGGVSVSSWGGGGPPPPPQLPLTPEGSAGPNTPDPNWCPIPKSWSSTVDVPTGTLHDTHSITPHGTFGHRSVTLHYNSSTADTRTTAQTEASIPAVSVIPDQFSSRARIGNVMGPESFITSATLTSGGMQSVRIAALLPTAGFPTGIYDYTLDMFARYPATTVSSSATGKTTVVNRLQSELGQGWGIQEIDRLFLQFDGSVLLVTGSGQTLQFQPGSEQTFFSDNFDAENNGQPQSNYTGFANWNVTQGCIDLMGGPYFDYYPGNGLYVDLDGSCFSAGTLESSTAFPLLPGFYTLRFSIGGSQRCCGTDTLNVSFGSAYFETFVLPWNGPVQNIARPIAIGQPQTARVRFTHAGGDNIGAILLSVSISRPGATFVSPAYEFSTLVRNGNGSYTRTLKDGTRIDFDGGGRQTAVIDRSNNRTSYVYDALGRIQSIVDPVGQMNPALGTLAFGYAGPFLGTITDPAGRVTQLEHDLAGHLTRIIDPDGSDRVFTYDGFGHLRTHRDKGGFVSSYDFDANGACVRASRPDASAPQLVPGNSPLLANSATGQATQATPAAVVLTGNVMSVFTDGNGKVSRTQADRFGRSLKEIDALGRTTLYERNTAGLITKITKPNGAVIRITYDGLGNPLSVIEEGSDGPSANDRTWAFTYGAFNQVATIIDPKGNLNSTNVTTRITYDTAGRPTMIRDANDTVTMLTYDEQGFGVSGLMGLLTRVNAAFGQPEEAITRYKYNSRGLLEEVTDPEGRKTFFTYHPSGAVHTVTAKGNSVSTADDETTTYLYDPLDRVTSITDALAHTTSLFYWPDGNLREVRDAKLIPGITSYTYDTRGRVQTRTDPLGNVESYLYDGEGNLLHFVDRKSQVFDWLYDDIGRPTHQMRPAVGGGIETVTYGYDANHNGSLLDDNDNLASAADADSQLIFNWTVFDELLSQSTSGSPLQPSTLITYGYDKNRNRISMLGTESGAGAFADITYLYDKLDRLYLQMDVLHGLVADYVYDRLSRRKELNRTLQGHLSRSCYGYNTAGDLTSIDHRFDPTGPCGTVTGMLISRFAYTYNPLGFRDSMTEDRLAFMPIPIVNATHNYGYDAVNRLISVTHLNDPGSAIESFTYDPVGNRLTTATTAALNWQYNVADQLTNDGTSTYTYDFNGNRRTKTGVTPPSQVTNYHYDAENRIATVDSGGTILTMQSYDPLGRRIRVTDASGIRFFVYDGEDAVLIGQGTSRTHITHGSGIDEPILYSTPGGVSLPFADGLGSITEETGPTGVTQRATRYQAFGVFAATFGQAQGALYGYTARELDGAIGLQYSRARHYDPAAGRFAQQDPIGIDSGSTNIYYYAQANVTNATDPYGLAVFKAVKWVLKGAKRIGTIPTGTISFKTAVGLRRAGKDCKVFARNDEEALRAARNLERAAHPGGDLIHHPKDTHLSGGNQAHFQTGGSMGHTFYSALAALSATTYLGEGLLGESIDFINPLTIPKDVIDIYDELNSSSGATNQCPCK